MREEIYNRPGDVHQRHARPSLARRGFDELNAALPALRIVRRLFSVRTPRLCLSHASRLWNRLSRGKLRVKRNLQLPENSGFFFTPYSSSFYLCALTFYCAGCESRDG